MCFQVEPARNRLAELGRNHVPLLIAGKSGPLSSSISPCAGAKGSQLKYGLSQTLYPSAKIIASASLPSVGLNISSFQEFMDLSFNCESLRKFSIFSRKTLVSPAPYFALIPNFSSFLPGISERVYLDVVSFLVKSIHLFACF